MTNMEDKYLKKIKRVQSELNKFYGNPMEVRDPKKFLDVAKHMVDEDDYIERSNDVIIDFRTPKEKEVIVKDTKIKILKLFHELGLSLIPERQENAWEMQDRTRKILNPFNAGYNQALDDIKSNLDRMAGN